MTLKYDVAGRGPTLVLVHGVVHRRQAWDAVLDRLTPHRRVITVDLPGHGESDPLPEDGEDAIEYMVSELIAFVREVEEPGQQVHIAGNSLGGYLSLVLAAHGEVASATALSPAGFFLGHADQARTINTFKAIRQVARAFGDRAPAAMRYRAVRYPSLLPFFAHPSRVAYEAAVHDVHSLTTNPMIDAGIEADFAFPQATEPRVPVTVAWGTRDLILPYYQSRRVRSVFPNATVIPVPGVGHVPMTDNPALIASILLAGSELPA
ncbi:alpha/beta fold hydrolase [Rhodococcus sp. NPDC003994]|uniref:Alpha/beta fold hydrolase n=1 Tax=Rhodococcoides kroppenstedtii TaxID=293050 RepID=A0ABS7NZ31_9NOCA|nr:MULTISPECIES: alpha/beta fold hydrolase [Rhodococcus]AMY21063.1 N-acyl homoserine lactonase [Rhodococcus sp. PBTS 1]MBY6315153.1 alpha/beta fold hydrolase [Rhodococcus kroppenstedtii]MBY6322823.1 alpha/beta fold hydrolase [Rhodococcus kroppenstedtii]MBY6401546.1 alpha/beta fold hydrolase [Rhodococcus kroppenstedtii]MBY6437214.1 alpha/beta fold hydrolase [Rhodococcus kroppenstedtii]